VKRFPAFYGTWRFITAYIRALHWSLTWVRWIQSTTSHPITSGSVLILPPYLYLNIPNGLLPSVLHLPHRCHMSRPLYFGTYILLSILFSDTLKLCSSRRVTDQVSQIYKTTDNVFTLIFTFSVRLFLSCYMKMAVVPHNMSQSRIPFIIWTG
jgi:hypothetical protein